MNLVSRPLTRYLVAFIGGMIVVTGVYAPLAAPRAHAQLSVVFDPTNFGVNLSQEVIMKTLNGIAWQVAKTAIQSMTRSIVNWVNSGYNGSPAFSQNLNRDLRQLGDAVASDFLARATQAVFTSPYIAPIAKDAVTAYYLSTSGDLLAERLRYTLLDYTQDSVAYMRGDFSQGGLSAWHALTYTCGNDPACVRFTTQDQLLRELNAESQKFLADFNNGRGFLSWQGECLETAPVTDLSDEKKCISYDVVTPGSVVEETLVEQLGSPVRQLELADSINEIVGAVVTQMVGQVLGGGGLAGLSSPRANGGGRPIDQATTPGTTGTGSTPDAGFASTVDIEIDRATETKAAWTDILALATQADQKCPSLGGVINAVRTSEIKKAIARANQMIPRSDTALTRLSQISALLESANDAPSEIRTNATQNAWNIYQQLLISNGLITDDEAGEASTARNEANNDSTYSHLKNYVASCS